MNEYEAEQYKEIEAWKNEAPGVVMKVMGVAVKPLVWLVEQIIPRKAMEGALNLADRAADFLADTKDVIRDGGVSTVDELRHKDLQLSDELADSVHNWAMGIAAAEGGLIGFLGLPGLAADIPALIMMSLRVVHKVGVCYGYECRTEMDQKFILGVLSAAGANTVKEKAAAVAFLQKVNVLVARNTWRKLATDKGILAVAITMIRNLAKQLGINITKRKVAQAIPVIGAGVGATMNAAMLNDMAWAARRMFQQRWLAENKKIALPID